MTYDIPKRDSLHQFKETKLYTNDLTYYSTVYNIKSKLVIVGAYLPDLTYCGELAAAIRPLCIFVCLLTRFAPFEFRFAAARDWILDQLPLAAAAAAAGSCCGSQASNIKKFGWTVFDWIYLYSGSAAKASQ